MGGSRTAPTGSWGCSILRVVSQASYGPVRSCALEQRFAYAQTPWGLVRNQPPHGAHDLNATTHAVFGVAALAGAGLVLGTDPPAYAYPVAIVAAWLPDVDNPRSTLGNGLSRVKNPVLNALIRPFSWALRTTSFVLVRTVGHRTLTHSILGVVLFSLPILLFLGGFPNLSLALVAGYASHVFADALNTRGVPLLWPVGRPFRLLPGGVRSGGAVEVAVALLALAFTLYALLLLYPALRGVIGLQPL